MGPYIARRLIQSLVILIGLTVVFFFILHVTPGGPCSAFEGGGTRSAAQQNACVRRLGLNRPLVAQYFTQMGIYLRGDFGNSNYGQSVTSLILSKLPATILLMSTSYLLQLLLALPLGIYSALRQYSFFDSIFTGVSYVGISLPAFWLGLILIFVFAVHWTWLPPGRVEDVTLPVFWSHPWFTMLVHDPALILGDLIRHLILPMITLCVVGIAIDSRFLRASMLETLHQDYIRTAKAKGVTRRAIVFKHAFRNAVLPIITNIALYLPALVGGAVIVETIFSWGGVGYLFITSVTANDYPTLQAILMMGAAAVLISNLLADLAYGWVDPRITYE
jgi:peptide/nickel transport system permease protein